MVLQSEISVQLREALPSLVVTKKVSKEEQSTVTVNINNAHLVTQLQITNLHIRKSIRLVHRKKPNNMSPFCTGTRVWGPNGRTDVAAMRSKALNIAVTHSTTTQR